MRRLLLLSCCAAALGCRGEKSSEPPVHLNPNMDHQAKFIPQAENPFFPDRRAQRPPVPGTIARGELYEDDHLYRGKVGGAFARQLPMPVSVPLLQRGKDRYLIYCRPCHGALGDGKSVLAARGVLAVPPPSYFDPRLQAFPVGEIYHVITNGVRTMPSFRAQIPVEDRWAIAAYVRTLQRSRSAALADVPAEVRAQNRWGNP